MPRLDPRFEPLPATPEQVRRLAAQLRDESHSPEADRRREPRHPLGPRTITMTAVVVGAPSLKRCISVYDLSTSGLAALVRGAPPLQSRLRLGLTTTRGALIEIEARARWVRAITDRYQAMGVRFERPIDLSAFI